jgi:hypothetical protein
MNLACFAAAFFSQAGFDFVHQERADAPPAKFRVHCQVIEHSAPPVVSADDRADDTGAGFGQEEQVGGLAEFLFDFFRAV